MKINFLGKKDFAKSNAPSGIKHALLATVIFLFIYTLASEDAMLGIALSLAVFIGVFALSLYMPKLRERALAEEVEKDLGFALMQMAVELNMNQQFEKCLARVAKGGYGRLSSEFRRIASEINEAGSSVQEALFNFSSRMNSPTIKRAVAQIVAAYEQGGGRNAGEPLKRMAIEHFAKQWAVSKEFSGKMVVFSLMFIAVSAIVPALFLAFVAVGSTFMELDFTAGQVVLIATVAFPAIDLAALLYIRGKTPRFLRG